MKSAVNSLVARFSDETTKRSNILPLVFGMLTAFAFSILLNRTAAPLFEFRLRPVEGTMDVPVIQNLRLRKL